MKIWCIIYFYRDFVYDLLDRIVEMSTKEDTSKYADCPICSREFETNKIEEHVNKCLFLNTQNDLMKRKSGINVKDSPPEKKVKIDNIESKPKMTKVKYYYIIYKQIYC